MQPSQILIHSPNTHTLYATQLVYRSPSGRFFTESELVPRTDHAESRRLVQRGLRLIQQSVSTSSARLSRCVQPHAALADPDKETTDPRRESNRGVRDACTGLKHQARQPTHWYLYADSILVHEHKRTVDNIDLTVLQKDDC
jgi:hypothetical protein